jgi:DNA modification methylase
MNFTRRDEYANGAPSAHRHTGLKPDKQGKGSRTYAGFNGRWDAKEAVGKMPQTRNARTVWTIATRPFPEAHFAMFPEELPARCIKAGCPAGGTVLDPFGGAGTTGLVAARLGRSAVLIELNPKYVEMTRARLDRECPLLAEVV